MKIRTVFILIAILLLLAFAAWAGYQFGYSPPLPPEIRTEIKEVMVPVEVVKEIKVEVPGPERVVEKVVWRTREVEIPGPVREVIQQIPVTEKMTGRVVIDAVKYEGLVDDELKRGWTGEADCQVRGESTGWHTLVREPFDKTLSFVESTDKPGTLEERLTPWRTVARLGISSDTDVRFGLTFHKRSRFGFWGDVDYALNPDSTTFYDYSQDGYQTISSDRWRVAGGVAVTLGRK